MPTILQYILIALAAIVVLCIVLKLFKVTFKTILKIAINAVIGVALIFLLNFIPGVNIPIVWWSALVAGIFGVVGVIVLLILNFFLF
ncbi:MAG TPA: pro-sigmaK processing inhibitor BofA family protein [Candidatus Borkfalkia stercoripullorum]|nr:pro-sigmaK processing inhibitor BofA family protein [Candidatus Borkfalkia stercoripullorum]